MGARCSRRFTEKLSDAVGSAERLLGEAA